MVEGTEAAGPGLVRSLWGFPTVPSEISPERGVFALVCCAAESRSQRGGQLPCMLSIPEPALPRNRGAL
ncbi:Hypothetical predicted protein, partial [Marmota monax]